MDELEGTTARSWFVSLAPNACSGGIVTKATSPFFMLCTALSSPSITWSSSVLNSNGSSPSWPFLTNKVPSSNFPTSFIAEQQDHQLYPNKIKIISP
uniref:Uncharacterized protein n=1 Tax=Arundo donax TaxID=35708 RepID=A0A0A9E7R4_ARUDO